MKNKRTLFELLRMLVVFVMVFFSFSTAQAEVWNVDNFSFLSLPSASIADIINNLATWLVGIFAFFGIIGFTVSGIMYLVSTGDDEMITKAKKYMLYSIMGVIVGLSGYVILKAADAMLNADLF